MSSLTAQLQAALGDAYTIERELGGGGMSRTFVAREHALDRRVVVKMLAPELLAGISVERFKREVLLAAGLQHPHVVPVHTAGDADGLPWFTMPYVEGDSLRARLAGGPLSFDEATGILRDVARALEFAHQRGIVHRDIKPDNVLLAGSSATVTDFGIAKAISASRTVAGDSALTAVGTVIGTPAYMAPEQAAGDPDVDHRADIYSFGVLAYELLAGRPPFVADSPSRVISAHFNETPRDVRELRPDTPPSLANLVMHCLVKDANQRPANATVLVQTLGAISLGGASGASSSAPGNMHLGRALAYWAAATAGVLFTAWAATRTVGLPDWGLPGAVGVMLAGLPAVLGTWYVQRTAQRAWATTAATPGGTVAPHGTLATLATRASSHVSWRRTWIGGGFAVGAFAILVVGMMGMRAFGIGTIGSLRGAGQFGDHETILVADFAAPAEDSLLGITIAEAVRTDLGQSANLKVISRSATREAVALMGKSAGFFAFEVAREVATREGAKAVLDGSVSRLGAGYVVSARLVSPLDGRELALFQRTADGDADLIAAVGKLSRDIRGKVGESLRDLRDARSLDRVTTSSLPALRKYVEGIDLISAQGNREVARSLLREALSHDSTFAMAWRSLAATYVADPRFRKERLESIRNAYRFRERLSTNERLLTEASYFSYGPNPDRDRAVAAYEALLARDSLNSAALNNAATRYFEKRDYARATALLERATALKTPFGGAFNNLVDVYVLQGDLAGAKTTLANFERRLPSHAQHWSSRALILFAQHQLDSVTAIAKQVVDGASSRSQREFASFVAGSTALVEGRPSDALRWLALSEGGAEAARFSSAARLRLALDTAMAAAVFGSDTLESRRLLRRALARVPLDSIDPHDRPLGAVSQIARLSRDAELARMARAQWLRDTVLTGGAEEWGLRFDLSVAIAENRPRDALDLLREADRRQLLPERTHYAEMANAFDLAGQADSAIVYYERLVTRPLTDFDIDPEYLAVAYKRLGEMYDVRGDVEKAVANYLRFADLWKNADPALQPMVQRARRRAQELGRRQG